MERITKALDVSNEIWKIFIEGHPMNVFQRTKYFTNMDKIYDIISEEQSNGLCIHVYDIRTNLIFKYTFCCDSQNAKYVINCGECHH